MRASVLVCVYICVCACVCVCVRVCACVCVSMKKMIFSFRSESILHESKYQIIT